MLLVLSLPTSALAHGYGPLAPSQFWSAWNWDPVLLLNLAILSGLYGSGAARLRGRPGAWPASLKWRAAAFAAGLTTIFVALVSPLDALSDQLSAAHMVQHMLLMLVAAPLLIVAGTGTMVFWSLPLAWRRGLGQISRSALGQTFSRIRREPLTIWFLHALVLWAWHVPFLYQAALRDRIVHDVQHLSLFAAGYLFWEIVLGPRGPRPNPGLGILYLFTTTLHATALGALMALSPRVWYSAYAGRTEAWGWTPLEDQQVAGFIMWMPACSVYVILAAIILGVWLQDPRKVRQPGGIP